jgi:hypothetical protein
MSLGDSARALAEENGFEYDKVDLGHLAQNQSPLRDYVVGVYVAPNDGMVDLPIYVLSTEEGDIQGSSIVTTLEEVNSLIFAWKSWANSQKP